MNFFDKINLKPMERRLVIAIALVVFVVFNVWWVWPHFKDWAMQRGKIAEAQAKLLRYQEEVALLPGIEKKLKDIESGDAVLPADQSVHFRRTIEQMAMQNRVFVQSWGNITPTRGGTLGTNQFFEELNLPIQATATEKDLVTFIYKLSSGGSSIRVRDLTLNPGQNMNVAGSMTLVASYQRSPGKSAVASTPKKP
ncbi:MAG: hypothetical protein HZA89_10925 [Verrucomicrobia bacterium]|nr:hypothetical protein [Verrucomicrobiota bacterium]